MIIDQMELGYMESDRPATIPSKTLSSTDNALKQKGKMVSSFSSNIAYEIFVDHHLDKCDYPHVAMQSCSVDWHHL